MSHSLNEFNAGERCYRGYHKDKDMQDHIERYEFALNYLQPNWICLDASCGSGYGSEILSSKVAKVIGIDISDHAIEYAKKNHSHPNIKFMRGDLNQPLEFPDQYFDAVISFETLEHIANQILMIKEFHRVLKSNGLLIISTPNRTVSEKAKIKNPFHTHELSESEFLEMLRQFFQINELYGQHIYRDLPKYKKVIKLIAKIDILKLNRKIFRILGLDKIKRQCFAETIYAPITQLKLNGPSNYYCLIAVAKKIS